MKVWLWGGVAVAVVIVVAAALLRSRPSSSIHTARSQEDSAESDPQAPPIPDSVVVPATDIRALLDQLVNAVIQGDLEEISRVQDRLRSIGLPAVGPMRRDVLGNEEGGHKDHRYHVAVKDTLLSMASPETGIELLNSWPEADRGSYPIPPNAVGLRLGLFSEVVVHEPPRDSGKRIVALYAAATTYAVKRSLIELMGKLQVRFPEIRAELLRILKEDPTPDLRSQAALALVKHDPEAVLPEFIALLNAALRDPGDRGGPELHGLMRAILDTLPFAMVMDRLKKEIGPSMEIHQVGKLNSLGFAVGTWCGGEGDPNLEVLLSRAGTEDSPGMKTLILGVLAGATLRKNTDPRLTDLAFKYLEDPTNEHVRSHALSMITALNRNEATVLEAFDKAWKDGGRMAYYAAGQLRFYLGRNPDSAAARTQAISFLADGTVETRIQVIEGLGWGTGAALAPWLIERLKILAESDPSEEIRKAATKSLRKFGG